MAFTTHTVWVTTGDKKNAGTDANVSVRFHSGDGSTSTDVIKLDNFFRNDFERGRQDSFSVTATVLDHIDHIELWRDSAGVYDEWHLNTVEVLCRKSGRKYIFPFYRWIKADYHYRIRHLDTSLPSDSDPFKDQREMELVEMKKLYEIEAQSPGMPGQVKCLPPDENFSDDYKWDIQSKKITLKLTSKIQEYFTGEWNNLDDLKNVYTKESLFLPNSALHWQEDEYFGSQRLTKVNHSVIRLCTVIPPNLAVTDDMAKPLIEGLTLQQAMDAKRLFFIDYKILEDIPCSGGRMICAPIALFFVNKDQKLMPVAIQLKQKPGQDNPVFLPTDPEYTWLTAKLWFNNADCSFHQSFTHLGATHLMMEGVAVVTNRNLSRSHPVFKLLAPHSLYLLAINTRALGKLVSPGGWVDKAMSIGRLGMFEIVTRQCGNWRMDVDGTLPNDLERRGVLDETVLPGYHYREDALPLYNILSKYVNNYLVLYYDSPKKIQTDKEVQGWAQELVKPVSEGGCGMQGIPGNGTFETLDQLGKCLTSVIFTCSVAHAATNFAQYDQYGFPPAYPAAMNGRPPTDKSPLKEECVLAALPDKPTTLDTMIITKILSDKGTNSLGDFEISYIVDPKAVEVVEEFRYELKKLSLAIKEKNNHRNPTYPWLDPDEIPNAISI
ncbi:allene oxide synthase-lipoxygenase protein-like isoform X2 [Mizuhopecten yessoensis]|uniref:Allene oxide synthase-lipoxygenase protein n=2 Tax=Mizuhopecten yessoensis TaxID=6573 RepID=A0A210Q646_MIZYE|nr:allene oxide synthase-lipoxygenase protein-like isoform X2 [Mizuhopecten yessoensis]OWF44210.1 Allene oxide synthase-lipoxygenase protein [Mizuhopecten yessoensis]